MLFIYSILFVNCCCFGLCFNVYSWTHIFVCVCLWFFFVIIVFVAGVNNFCNEICVISLHPNKHLSILDHEYLNNGVYFDCATKFYDNRKKPQQCWPKDLASIEIRSFFSLWILFFINTVSFFFFFFNTIELVRILFLFLDIDPFINNN